ncbi:hypothetical protein CYMTET_7176 [Cymbomonas tetramitiformis]|uniref:Uncharacterized protein n=1 Tax=Cymbomonas tetramitiformis TaxID=36881 RepID=A0AAE0GVI2_9CHLO|nr:hypothetical protein CYMTET_7176 [Cymbomonas tetramitiformis]
MSKHAIWTRRRAILDVVAQKNGVTRHAGSWREANFARAAPAAWRDGARPLSSRRASAMPTPDQTSACVTDACATTPTTSALNVSSLALVHSPTK